MRQKFVQVGISLLTQFLQAAVKDHIPVPQKQKASVRVPARTVTACWQYPLLLRIIIKLRHPKSILHSMRDQQRADLAHVPLLEHKGHDALGRDGI